MENLTRAIRLIQENESQADFVGPRDEDIVSRAEQAIGGMFPPTYRVFLKELGCGSFAGDEFYGVINDNFTNSSVPNGIWLTLDERSRGNVRSNHIIVAETGDGGYYVLDNSTKDSNGEHPVVAWYPGMSQLSTSVQRVADTFGSFLLERTTSAI